MIYGQRHEEQMGVDSRRGFERDRRPLQDPVEPLLLDRLSEGVLGIASARHRACGMFAGVEVREEVVVLGVDVIDEIGQESVGIDLSGQHVLLQLPAVPPVEHAGTTGGVGILRNIREVVVEVCSLTAIGGGNQ